MTLRKPFDPERLAGSICAVTRAEARANIALVKYWGKRDSILNLPVRGSLSLTLEALKTVTSIDRLGRPGDDELILDGAPADEEARARVQRFLDLVRARRGVTEAVRVESNNHFPTAAGLASSASAFAALAAGAARAFEVDMSPEELSVFARRGSGSAARSVFGGFVRMFAGERADGDDAFAAPVTSKIALSAAIAIVGMAPKKVGSTDGMEHTRDTSPFHEAWVTAVDPDLQSAERALSEGDFETLATVTEGNCLAMHANAMSARPGLLYWKPATVALIHEVRALRQRGVPVFFTIDAGPHVVAFCDPGALDEVADALRHTPGVERIIRSAAGDGVWVS